MTDRYAITRFRGLHSWLSNFYPCVIRTADGMTWPSLEHAYQGAKCEDPRQKQVIRDCSTPGVAKRLGRNISLTTDWGDVRLEVMHDLLQRKFGQNPGLAKLLLATGECQLVEGNDWDDTFWGVCRGKGDNHLGRLLMQVRGELREFIETEIVAQAARL